MDLDCFKSVNLKKVERDEHQLIEKLMLQPISTTSTNTDAYHPDVDCNNSSSSNKSNLWKQRTSHFNEHNEIQNFHNVFVYLNNKKLKLTSADSHAESKTNIAWSTFDKHLVYTCDNGNLKICSTRVTPVNDISINTNTAQILKGHASRILCLSFNKFYSKLASSDSEGLTIVWSLHHGEWFEEMRHSRSSSSNDNDSTSKLCTLEWSPKTGSRICIIYENGFVKIGTIHGTHIWDKHLSVAPMQGVMSWSPDETQLLIPNINGEIGVYDSNNGEFVSNVLIPELNAEDKSKEMIIVGISWFSGKRTMCVKLPTLAIVFKYHGVIFLHDINDSKPFIVTTNLNVSCGDWSPNGNYFAICGQNISTNNNKKAQVEKVVIFTAGGTRLQHVNIPSKNKNNCPSPSSSSSHICWNSTSLHLAIMTSTSIYFAHLRPNYKFTFYGKSILVYAYGKIDGSSHIGFWDQQNMLNVQDIPGLVIDLKGNDEFCALLTLNRDGIYNVFLIDAHGMPVDYITITNIEPFNLVLTDSTICCIASNAILIWKYKFLSTGTPAEPNTYIKTQRKRVRIFHLDDTSSNNTSFSCLQDGKISNSARNDEKFQVPTRDPAICSDGINTLLVVLCSSGKIMLYALPNGTFIICMESICSMNIKPTRLFVNMDGSQLALINSRGTLCTCNLEGQVTVKVSGINEVWDVLWSKDSSNVVAVMTQNKLCVIDNGYKLEEIDKCAGHLLCFKNLQVSTILLDHLINFPEASPTSNLILRYEIKPLRDMKYMIATGCPTSNIMTYVIKHDSQLLWSLLGQTALYTLHLDIADISFITTKNYSGVQFLKCLETIDDGMIQKAEVEVFSENYDLAEKFYIEADRRDLAIEMWKILGDWNRAEFLNIDQVSSRQQKGSSQLIIEEFSLNKIQDNNNNNNNNNHNSNCEGSMEQDNDDYDYDYGNDDDYGNYDYEHEDEESNSTEESAEES